jgi:hypothetical protein
VIYANCSDGEIEVFGDAAGLRQLVHFLVGGVPRLEFEVDRTQRNSLERIEFREREGQLSIGAENSALVIAGAKNLLRLLAQNIEFLIEDDSPSASDHLHIEYVPDHYYLSEQSIPVVVTKVENSPPPVPPHRRV